MTDEFINYGIGPSWDGPLPLPTGDPDAAPLVCIEVNLAWVPYILGAIRLLKYPELWQWTNESEKALATARAEALIDKVADIQDCASSSLCVTLAQIMAAAEGNLALFLAGLLAATLESCGQYLKEQLEEILSLKAIFQFFFGETTDVAEMASLAEEYEVTFTPPQYQMDGCDFQVSYDAGATWETLMTFSLEACPALQGPIGQTGSQGIQGIQGPIGETGLDGQKGDKGDPGPTSGATVTPINKGNEASVCAGAAGVANWAMGLVNAGLAEAAQNAAALSVASAIMGETIIGDIVLNDLLEMAAGWLALGASVIAADDTPAAEQEIICAVYCGLKDISGQVTAQAILDSVSTLPGNANLYIAAVGNLMLASGGEEFLAAYVAESTNEDNSCAVECTDCPGEWCYTFNEENHLHDGWTAAAGTYSDARWNHTDTVIGGGGRRLIQLTKEFTSTPVTFIRLTYDLTKGDYSSATTAVALFSNGVRIANLAPAQAVNGTGLTFTWTGNQAMDDLTIQVQSSADFAAPYVYGGLGHLAIIEMHGQDANPFGSSNCEA